MRFTRRRAQVRRVQSPLRLRPQTGTWIGGTYSLEAVELEGVSAEVVVLRVFVSENNGNREGMLRQVVGDVTRKVTAARMRGDIEECMLLEVTLADKVGEVTEEC